MNTGLNKVLLSLLSILFLLGLFLLGLNVSGYLVYDDTVRPLCESDDECVVFEEVCCFFYEQNSGVCHSLEYCSIIDEITFEGYNYDLSVVELESPSKNAWYYPVALSLILIIIVILILLLLKSDKGTSRGKSTKKRKR